jgi:hypothetical protein
VSTAFPPITVALPLLPPGHQTNTIWLGGDAAGHDDFAVTAGDRQQVRRARRLLRFWRKAVDLHRAMGLVFVYMQFARCSANAALPRVPVRRPTAPINCPNLGQLKLPLLCRISLGLFLLDQPDPFGYLFVVLELSQFGAMEIFCNLHHPRAQRAGVR